MSYSMLESLFNGKIVPWERKRTPSQEHLELENQIEHERKYFIEKMSLDDCKRFELLYDLFMALTYKEEVEIYSHGFIHGSLMIMEVMEKKETLLQE